MFRLSCGGGVVGGGSKPQVGLAYRHGHAPSHRAPPPARKKSWSFIHPDSLSYDTFFTMKRLIERSQRPEEVLRWICQNPSKVCHSHFVVALQRLAQLIQAPPPSGEAPPTVTETPATIPEAPPPIAEDPPTDIKIPPSKAENALTEAPPTDAQEGGAKAADRKWTLEHDADFLSLCDAIVRDVGKFNNFSLVNCLYAAAALGLPGDSGLVRELETEAQSRVPQFNQKDLSMLFSSTMRLHHLHQDPHTSTLRPQQTSTLRPPQTSTLMTPQTSTLRHPQTSTLRTPGETQTPEQQLSKGEASGVDPSVGSSVGTVGPALTEACVSALERSLERERHPQTLFLLLSFYRGRRRDLLNQLQQSTTDTATAAANRELQITNRRILRVVKHTLSCVSAVRDQEMALLDEMLAACASETTNKSLEVIFSSHLFHQNRQVRFIGSLAVVLQAKADGVSPCVMAMIARYVARHRLRDTRLLDTIALFLHQRADQLDSKVIQRLVFPFSRMSYRPGNAEQLFSRLEQVLELKALSSPLATVNILMSLFQLQYYCPRVLQRVFSQAFICSLTNSPYVLIVRRYLSLLDAAVHLEFREYSGPRLNPSHRVLMFTTALTADQANRKYSYKGLVAEALRQLIGEQHYKQDQILPPGYYTDFLLCLDSSRRVLPVRSVAVTTALEADPEETLPVVGGALLHHLTPIYGTQPTNQDVCRVVLSVNDKWHYCHNSQILVGSRAMRDRHLQLLGYHLIQLPFFELEKLNGIEDVKTYLHQRLVQLPL